MLSAGPQLHFLTGVIQSDKQRGFQINLNTKNLFLRTTQSFIPGKKYLKFACGWHDEPLQRLAKIFPTYKNYAL